jgi:HIRAN domain
MPKTEKKTPKTKIIDITVRGLMFYVTPDTMQTMSEVVPMPVRLEREPTNAHDPNAIKVIVEAKPWKDFHIGHVAKQTAEVLASKMDDGSFNLEEATLVWIDVHLGEAGVEVRVPRG